MICQRCRDQAHALCEIGCCCQHAGSGVPWMDTAARHALALGRLDAATPPVITINSNGDRNGA